jgi:chorismate-pyruvate lyase
MILKIVTLLGIITSLSSCTTDNPTPTTLNEVVYNNQSMTTMLRTLSSDFTVTVLKSEVEEPNYVRIVELNLRNTPVIVAISSTNLNNPTFVNLLKNSQDVSIGNKLFANDSQISRLSNMTITNVRLKNIRNPIISNYLISLGYTPTQQFVKRHSYFNYKTETMDLIEYVLPSLNKFVKQ